MKLIGNSRSGAARLLATLAALIVAVAITPGGASAGSAPSAEQQPSTLSTADWRQIRGLLGITSNNAPALPPFRQEAYVKASNTGAADFFGWSVAISGDTVVVGAPGEDSSATGVNGDETNNSASAAGAAYVFTRSAGAWSQQAYLKASYTWPDDNFGWSVAVSGDTVVVGAYREDSLATGVNGNQIDNSATDAGAAYVFTRSAGAWSQQAYVKASNTGAGDRFGWSVAIDADTVVVGAYR